jgi:predicted nucleotidyltransferase
LAFLFGSLPVGREMKESDVDIAIYLKEKQKRARIHLELCRILEREVDLIDLEEAPASLVSNVFKTGIPLSIKDEKLYWELYLKMSNEAEDFFEFVEDFWKIKQRAKSLIK